MRGDLSPSTQYPTRHRGRLAALLAALSLGAAACSGGFAGEVAVSGETKPEVPQTHLVEVLSDDADGRFTTLLGLVTAHDGAEGVTVKLADVLTGPGPVTLFAPVNDAFADVDLDSLNVTAVENEDGTTSFTVDGSAEPLFDVLSAHVVTKDVSFSTPSYVTDGKVDGRVELEDYGLVIVDSTQTLTTVGEDDLDVEVGGTVQLGSNSVTVIEADVQAPNGFIQVIDALLG